MRWRKSQAGSLSRMAAPARRPWLPPRWRVSSAYRNPHTPPQHAPREAVAMSYSRADQTLELPTTGAFATAQRAPRTRRPSRAPRFLVAVLFLAYLVLLTWLIVWKLEVPFVGWGETRHLKLIPFIASEGYAASKPLEVLANVAVFVPFGLCTGYLWRVLPGPKTFFAAGFTSLAMETTQFALAVGSFDTSDIVANTVGALLGAAVVAPSVRRAAFS
ncbi:hypothetical protein C5E06_07170 [Pseudoclavibacter sp. RFBI5]|nr:hypothetical protein C5E06_07170 [Pseudoclavibacter sp. RFBI5]